MSGPVYVYGIVESERAPKVGVAGVPGTRGVRAVEVAEGVQLVLADADPATWAEDAIAAGLRDMDWVSARAVAHDEVLAALLDAPGVVPMKAFTLFSSEAKAREDVRARLPVVRAVLARVRGSVEWGLRMRLDEARARARQLRDAGEEPPRSGAAFLQRKKKLQDATKNARSDAYAAAREAAEAIARLGAEARSIPVPQVSGPLSLLLELAILAPKSATAAIEAELGARREALAAVGVEPELTGPWAPFHFASPKEEAEPPARPKKGTKR